MSKILAVIVVAVIGAGAYYYLNQPEPTPAEQLQSAAEEASDAVSATQEAASDAASSITEQASEAASAVQDAASDAVDNVSEQAADAAAALSEQATDAAESAGDQVAALTSQGQELFNTWLQDGMLTAQQFDYDAMVASVQDSTLSDTVKTQAIAIFDKIKASPETLVAEIQKLRTLLTQ
jgi:polyhydroxyalkanoate synthesis regulator phasin